MKEDLTIIKRDGSQEHLDIQKLHKVVNFACEGLAGVSSSQIQMNAGIQFVTGMSSRAIQDLLIRSANDLITLENPNYQYAAARLLLYGIYKDVFGGFEKVSSYDMVKRNIKEMYMIPRYLTCTQKKNPKRWKSISHLIEMKTLSMLV